MISVEDWAEIRRLHRAEEKVVTAVARDLLALAGLGLALLVMFGLTVAGDALLGAMPGIAHAIGWHGTILAAPVRTVLSLLASVVVDWLVFWWVFTTVPRVPVRPREARWPALVTAIRSSQKLRRWNRPLRAPASREISMTFPVRSALVIVPILPQLRAERERGVNCEVVASSAVLVAYPRVSLAPQACG